MFKKIFVFSIIFVLFLLTSVSFATDTINMDLTDSTTSNTQSNSLPNNISSNVNSTTLDPTTIDNANSDLPEERKSIKEVISKEKIKIYFSHS